MASDPHFDSVKLLTHLDGVDEATVAVDKSNSGHALTFVGSAELDTAVKEFGTASVKLSGDDPDFASVVLLVDFDGVDASTTFTDDSNSAHSMTALNNAQVDTAVKKFGTASGLFDDDTAADQIQVGGTQTDFDFGTGDFTIEAFVQSAVGGGDGNSGGIFNRGGSGTGSYVLSIGLFGTNTALRFHYNAVQIAIGTTVLVDGAPFHHVAVSRVSGTLRLFFDGVKEGGDVAFADDITTLALDAFISNGTSSPNIDGWDGWIDELRVTKGVGRYVANFTPPTAAFPRS